MLIMQNYAKKNYIFVKKFLKNIFCRLIEYEKRNSGFFGISRGDRKKLYDTILRNLRALND